MLFPSILIYDGVGGDIVTDDFKLLFDTDEIKKKLKPLLMYDNNDEHTFNYFTRKLSQELTIRDLEVMEETINLQISKGHQFSNLIISGISVIVAILIGLVAIIFSLKSYVPDIFSILMVFFLVMTIIIALIVVVNIEDRLSKRFSDLKNIIRILRYIKFENQVNP